MAWIIKADPNEPISDPILAAVINNDRRRRKKGFKSSADYLRPEKIAGFAEQFWKSIASCKTTKN